MRTLYCTGCASAWQRVPDKLMKLYFRQNFGHGHNHCQTSANVAKRDAFRDSPLPSHWQHFAALTWFMVMQAGICLAAMLPDD